MESLKHDTVGGFNKFIAEQRLVPGNCYNTLWHFDHGGNGVGPRIVQQYQAKPLSEVPLLTVESYMGGHGGGTPLLEAVGVAIETYEKLPIKADKTIFVIMTDGEENQSAPGWTWERVMALIERHQSEDGWAFIFLGAGTAAWQGQRMGTQSSGSYVASPAGTRAVYSNVSRNTALIRASAGAASARATDLKWDTDED